MPPRAFVLQQRVTPRRLIPSPSHRLFSSPSAVSPPAPTPTTPTPPAPAPPSPRARPRRREAVELGFEPQAWFVPAGSVHSEPVDAILDAVAAGEDAATLPQALFASRVAALAAFGRNRGFVTGVGAARYALCLEWTADALERPECGGGGGGGGASCGASFRRLADVQVSALLDSVLALPQHVGGDRRLRRAWSARLATAAAARLPPRYLRRSAPLRLLRKLCDATAAAPAPAAADAAAAASAGVGRLPAPLAEAALARLTEPRCIEEEEGDALALLLVLQREGCRSEEWQGVYERRMEGAVRRLEEAAAASAPATAVVAARLYAALGYVRFAGAKRRGPLHGRLCSVLEEEVLPVAGLAETLARRARGDHGFRTALVASARTFGPRLLSPVMHPRLSRFVRGTVLREEVVGLLAAADGIARGLVGTGHTAVDAIAALERWAAVLLPATATAANPAAPAEGIPAASVAGMRSLLAAVNLALQRPGGEGVRGGGSRRDASPVHVRTRAELECLHHEALSLWEASAAPSAGVATVESETAAAAAAAAMPLQPPSKAALRSHAAFVRGVGVRDVLRLRRALSAVLATAAGAEEAARVRGFYRRVEALVAVEESEDGTPGLSALLPPLYAAAVRGETVAAAGASVHAAFERSLLRALGRGRGSAGADRRLALDELLRCACVVARFGAQDAKVWEKISEAAAAAAAAEAEAVETSAERCGEVGEAEAEVAAARPAALALSRILQAGNGLAGAVEGASAAVEGGGGGEVLGSADLRVSARKAFSSLMFVLLRKQR